MVDIRKVYEKSVIRKITNANISDKEKENLTKLIKECSTESFADTSHLIDYIIKDGTT